MAISESASFGKIKHKKKISSSDLIFYVIVYSVFVLFAVVTLYPLINMLAYSFDSIYDAADGHVHFFPREWTLDNYERLFRNPQIVQGILITSARTALGTFASLVSTALLAFILSRKKFLFKSSLSLFWIITLYAQGGIIPTQLLYHKYLHLTNGFWVYVIPCLISAFNVMVMRTYMQSIPESLEEAAQMEGAGYMRVFWSVITPLCKPVYAVIALFIAVFHWNSWFDSLLFNRLAPEYTTLQYEVMKLMNSVVAVRPGTVSARSVSIQPIRSAACVLSMIPVIIIYPFFQRYFVDGVTIRGIKE